MPRKKSEPTPVKAVRLKAEPSTGASHPPAGDDHWWQVRFIAYTLFGEWVSPWHVVNVAATASLNVWVRFPEGADLFELKQLSCPKGEPLRFVIDHMDRNKVRVMTPSACRTLRLIREPEPQTNLPG